MSISTTAQYSPVAASASSADPVDVSVQSFTHLFDEGEFALAVDTYQRGFVWSDEKVKQLIDDLLAYQRAENQSQPYYMGTVLLHRHASKEKRFIIDGQQRLTALCVLYQFLLNELPGNCALTYSPQSARRIRAAAKIFTEHGKGLDGSLFAHVVFTVICVDRVDLAFTFFDTQNNRGVPLHATDLLKAYHLRAVNGATTARKEALQTQCAQRWERIQEGKALMSHEQEFAASLFSKFLWRARYWTGRRVLYGGHDALMEEFQKQTWVTEGDDDTIPLYRARHNRLGTALTMTSDGHSEIHSNRISLSPKAEDLPFAIRQPIDKGIGFFLYADKYAGLLHWLLNDATESNDVLRFREVYSALLMANSLFLREVFLLAVLMYVDQFGAEQLWEFSLWLEHALGAIRMSKQQVRYEAAQNFFKDDVLNLLDVIAGAYRPKQVIDYLQRHHKKQEIYSSKDVDAFEKGARVQGIYKQAVLNYYGHEALNSLQGKAGWISVKLTGGAA